MFRLYDKVKLKVGDQTNNVTPDQIGIIVDIAQSIDGKHGYTVEFIDGVGASNISALEKYYEAKDLIKID